MRPWCKAGLILAVGASSAAGQVVERDVKVTGPRGRTIERQVRTERGPGRVEREIDIKRPGGELHRDVVVQRGGGRVDREVNISRPGGQYRGDVVAERGGRRPPPTYGREYGYVGHGDPHQVFVEAEVHEPPPDHPWGFGWGPALSIGGHSFGLSIGPAHPPIYVAPPHPPVVVVHPPVRYAPAPPPEEVVVDPVADAIARLSSYSAGSRRDGALTLGRLGDSRAVLPLIDRLKLDFDKDVRIASAWALSEIGDPRAGVALERAALFDKRQEVRDAASRAYRRLPAEGTPAPAQGPPPAEARGPDPGYDPNTPPPPPSPDDPSAFRQGP